MKLLESIAMVQFFLYEREDLTIGRNTAFLGPNGTGKTALLDAIQTVMLAADGTRTHFNASGEGKKRARTLRDYCLGVYGQTQDARCRNASNTYIDLVFRDEATGVPVTAGVSLAATADNPDVIFNSLYILPGVALTSGAHMEHENGRDIVVPWRSFQHMAAELCRTEGNGSSPLFTSNREEFSRRLLIEQLAAPGDRPNVQSFKMAFARSLKLNQDVNDLSEMLRQHLIEARPTNVREFRARLDQFREVRDLIRVLKVRIERAGQAVDKYGVVQRERTSEANLECLKAVYNTERLGTTLGEADEAIESMASQLSEAQTAQARAVSDAAIAMEARDRALAALNRDPDYRRQAGQAERLGDLETDHERQQSSLRNSLASMNSAVLTAGRLPELATHRVAFEEAMRQTDELERMRVLGQIPPTVAITSALRAVATVHDVTRRAAAEADADLKQAQAAKRDAKLAMERAGRGLAPLRASTRALLRVLSDAGITATPICDLVTIVEPDWQPVFEAYLGPHVDALLVSSADEIKAIDVYRGLKGAQRVYRVKLALPSRLREWRRPGDGRYAADLIAGDNADAVRYLKGELGRTLRASSSAELRAGEKAITIEGMVCSGGGVERLELAAADQLLIGRRDTQSMRDAAERALSDSETLLSKASIAASTLERAAADLAPFANVAVNQATIEAQLAATARTALLLQDLRAALSESQTAGLAELQMAKAAADEHAAALRKRETELAGEVARIEERLKLTRSRREALQSDLQLASAQERTARQHALYSGSEVDRHRTRLDERHGEHWIDKLQACNAAIQRARATAENADKEAWSLFTQYVTDYHLKNHDIVSAQWMRAFEFLLADRKRLLDLELADQEEKSERAYQAAVRVFRTDVAQALLAGFDRIEEQRNGLNAVLNAAPPFSNNEHYQFRSKVVDQHRALHTFLERVREAGGDESDIFGGAGEVPDEFRALVDGDGNSELLQESSPLHDHRRFFSYDVEIFQDGKSIGWLSKRFGPGSGGEHRTPLYVIFGSALAAAYGKGSGSTGGSGIMLLDEAFEKMDPQNVRATADYLNALGLQLVMAGPETDQPKMSSFLNVYYDMARFGTRTIQLTKTEVSDLARELLQSDSYLSHPELLAAEKKRLTPPPANGAGDVAG